MWIRVTKEYEEGNTEILNTQYVQYISKQDDEAVTNKKYKINFKRVDGNFVYWAFSSYMTRDKEYERISNILFNNHSENY